MKTKCLLISSDNLLVKKLKSEEDRFDVVHHESVLSAASESHQSKDSLVVLYAANANTEVALEQINFLRENLRKDVLLYVLAKQATGQEELFVRGVADVFPENVEISQIYERVQLVGTKSNGGNRARARSESRIIPVWKRVFDVLFASAAIIGLSPVFVAIAIAIRLESKGKVFYASKRIGSGYKQFDFYKFRSMYSGADKKVDALLAKNQYGDSENENKGEAKSVTVDQDDSLLISDTETIPEKEFLLHKREKEENSFFKMVNDPRITRVGRILRNTSLDEIPQLFNILKGDMSVVGNRPLPLYEAELLTGDEWALRFLGPAGLTGLWQVTKRGGSNSLSADERKQLDIEYVKTFSLKGDLSIILRTVGALRQHENV